MIDAALSAALLRLDQSIDAVEAATIAAEQQPPGEIDSMLRQEVRAAIAELDSMLGPANG